MRRSANGAATAIGIGAGLNAGDSQGILDALAAVGDGARQPDQRE